MTLQNEPVRLVVDKLVELGKMSAEQRDSVMMGARTPSAVWTRLTNALKIPEKDILDANVALGERRDPSILISSDISPDADALMLITGDYARQKVVMPYFISERKVSILIPLKHAGDVILQDELRKQTQRTIEVFYSSTDELKFSIDKAYRAESELRDIARTRVSEDEVLARELGTEEFEVASDSAAVKFVDLIFNQAIEDRASDIHIEQDERFVIVRFRIDGVLKDINTTTPKSMANEIVTRIKILADIDIAEKRKPQDGKIRFGHKKKGNVDLRIAILPTVWGEKIVMRVLDNSSAMLTLDRLGFTESNLSRFRTSYKKPYGMLLATGPTGSGKSTTLYAALNDLVSPEVNIITVEDPVEYRIPRINQVQVNPKAGMTFASALRSILRADPDIILLGEIRDQETARIAVEAAQTGHLVLSTLHTNDAPGAISRLIDLGVDKFLVGSVIESIIGQRLVRRLCKECKNQYTPDPDDLISLEFPFTPGTQPPKLYEPVGCKVCSHTGYKGRMAIHEVLSMSPELKKTITHEGSTSQDLIDAATRNGMKPLKQDGWQKVRDGETSIAEVLRVA